MTGIPSGPSQQSTEEGKKACNLNSSAIAFTQGLTLNYGTTKSKTRKLTSFLFIFKSGSDPFTHWMPVLFIKTCLTSVWCESHSVYSTVIQQDVCGEGCGVLRVHYKAKKSRVGDLLCVNKREATNVCLLTFNAAAAYPQTASIRLQRRLTRKLVSGQVAKNKHETSKQTQKLF